MDDLIREQDISDQEDEPFWTEEELDERAYQAWLVEQYNNDNDNDSDSGWSSAIRLVELANKTCPGWLAAVNGHEPLAIQLVEDVILSYKDGKISQYTGNIENLELLRSTL